MRSRPQTRSTSVGFDAIVELPLAGLEPLHRIEQPPRVGGRAHQVCRFPQGLVVGKGEDDDRLVSSPRE